MTMLHYLPFLAALTLLGIVMMHRARVRALIPVKYQD